MMMITTTTNNKKKKKNAAVVPELLSFWCSAKVVALCCSFAFKVLSLQP